MIKLKRAE